MASKPTQPARFDEAYYERYYTNPRTRVYQPSHHAKLVTGIVNLVEWFGVEIKDVLDAGAGLGWWGRWFRRHRPKAKVLSTELEPSICKKYGHLQADVTVFRLPKRFDLVICQGVLPYLSDACAKQAMHNLSAMCGGFLYLEAVTTEDIDDCVDLTRTDLSVQLRSGAWYRRLLREAFREVGAGLFVTREARLPLYTLEVATR